MNLRTAALELTQLIFPPRCEVCNAFSPDPFCPDCRAGIVPVGEDLCLLCGVPFPPNTTHPPTCAACRGRDRPWAFDSARAFGLHCGPLRRAVIRLKFDGRTQLAPVLAEMLAHTADRVGWRSPAAAVAVSPLSTRGEGGWGGEVVIIPALLHPSRRKWRGFDQALMLSRHLGKNLDLPVWEDVIRRVKATRPQIELTPAQRLENLRGAFEALCPERLAGARVILVDDVFTTGATLQAASSALKNAGATEVHCITITRAVPDWHPAALTGDPPENQ